MFEKILRSAVEHSPLVTRATDEVARQADSTVRKALPPTLAGSKLAARESLATSAVTKAATELRSPAEKAVMTAPTLHNKITFHVNPEASQQALLDSIAAAKKSFYIETFIWHNDESGNAIIDALGKRIAEAKASGETFDARVMIDWFGLHQGTGGTGDPMIVDKLRKVGVNVIEFSPGYVTDGKLIPITHRKLYIKDGESFISGGRNIGNEYLQPTFTDPKGGTQTSWHDLMYTVEGDETGRIIDQFFHNWEHAGGTLPEVKPEIVPSKAGRARVQSFVTNPLENIHDLQKAQLGLIANAKKEIVVMYPYFSDNQLINALREAKRKNPALGVKVMLPASREVTAEGGVYTLLNRDAARQLMQDGIEVRMFSGGSVDGKAVERFSHFKAMTVDGKILSIGSANGDARTFNSNHELINVIADAKTARDFHHQVVGPDWASARPLTSADLAKDSWLNRIKEHVLELFGGLL